MVDHLVHAVAAVGQAHGGEKAKAELHSGAVLLVRVASLTEPLLAVWTPIRVDNGPLVVCPAPA